MVLNPAKFGHTLFQPSSPGKRLIAVAILTTALLSGVVAAYMPLVAGIAIAVSIGGAALWAFLRSIPITSVSGSANIPFQLALGALLISLVRIAERDPTSGELGVQAIYEFSLQGLAAALVVLGILANRSRFNFSPGLILWIVFGTFAMISAFWAPQLTLSVSKGMQLVAVCVVAGTVASHFENRQQALRFLAWFMVLIIVVAILFQGATDGFGNLRTLTGESDGRYRLNLLTIHPIHLGSLSGTLAILLLLYRRRRIDWLAISFLVTTSVLTAARGPIGLLLLIMFFYVILKSRINVASYVGWALGIIMAIFIMSAGFLTLPGSSGSEGPSSVFGNLERDITTLNGRIPLWQAILSRMDAEGNQTLSPILGHGYASFRHFGLSQFSYAGDAHNALIQVFSELGLTGALIWLLAIGQCSRQVWHYSDNRRSGLISLLPILYIMGTQMVDASLADSRSFLLVILVYYAHVSWQYRSNESTLHCANGNATSSSPLSGSTISKQSAQQLMPPG